MALCAVGVLLALFGSTAFKVGLLPLLICAVLTGLGVRDHRQAHHAILRNYPIIGHLRFLSEFIRTETRQ